MGRQRKLQKSNITVFLSTGALSTKISLLTTNLLISPLIPYLTEENAKGYIKCISKLLFKEIFHQQENKMK